MEVVTRKYNVYNFNELSKEIQKKLIEKEIQDQNEFYLDTFLIEDMKEAAKELLQKYFKNNKTEFEAVYYDLSYCQGRGAMIEFNLYYYNKYVKIKHYGNYEHERSFTIDDAWELTKKQEEQLYNKIVAMNEELVKIGDDLIQYTISEDEAIDFLSESKYLKDGTIF